MARSRGMLCSCYRFRPTRWTSSGNTAWNNGERAKRAAEKRLRRCRERLTRSAARTLFSCFLDIDFISFQSPSDGGRLPFDVLGILTKRDNFTRGSLTRSSPPWIVRRNAGVSHVIRETRLNSP